jgi:hypothetical protein
VPALISLVGASSRAASRRRPSPDRRRRWAPRRRRTDRAPGEGDGALGAALAVERHQRREVEIGEHVAVDDHEGLVDPAEAGGEADGTGRVERFGLDGVGQADAGGRPSG